MEADLSAYLADVKESVSSAGGAADAPISAPLSIVIFGATGDLAREKLYPSLVQLMRKGLLPYGSTIMAYGRSAVAIEDFCAKQLVKVDFLTAEEETRFIGCLQYFQGGYDKEEDFQRLGTALSAHETPGTDRLYFLSVPPTVFGSVCSCINRHSRAPAPGLTRVLVEKPFGRDSRTFAELNGITSAAFEEAELFRLDHYLAKQSIQNFNRQRVQRGCFFNSVWDNRCIQSLHVSWKEDIDTEGRGGYFDEFGIIRDIVQNHLLQLLMVACMDPPADPTAEAVAQAKVAFLRCVSTVQMSDVVLGQFEGYLQDKTVPEGSRCPTYAAISFTVDNDRWRGVPIMITAGKGLSERTCTVSILSLLSKWWHWGPAVTEMCIRRACSCEGIDMPRAGSPGAGRGGVQAQRCFRRRASQVAAAADPA
jgi:glucose-6-phosphate 1-dehydrogenase